MIAEAQSVVILGGVGVLVLLVGFLYLKEKEHTRRSRIFERTVEDLNKRLYATQKRLKEMELEREGADHHFSTRIKSEIKGEFSKSLESLLHAVRSLEEQSARELGIIEERMRELEEKVHEFGYYPGATSTVDEKKIMEMFEAGWGLDSIARELRTGRGEVELTLRLNHLLK